MPSIKNILYAHVASLQAGRKITPYEYDFRSRFAEQRGDASLLDFRKPLSDEDQANMLKGAAKEEKHRKAGVALGAIAIGGALYGGLSAAGAAAGSGSGAATGSTAAGAASSGSSAALGSGISVGAKGVGLQAASTLGLTATPAGVAAFESGIGLSQLGAASAGVGAAASSSGTAATKAATKAAAKGIADTEILGTGITLGDVSTGLSAASTVMGLRAPDMPAIDEELPTREQASADIPKSRMDMETRRQKLAGLARAAGVRRSGNQADFLGSGLGVKRRGAARASLYGTR